MGLHARASGLWPSEPWLAVLATPAAAAVPDAVVTGPIPSAAAPGDPSRNYIFFASLLDLETKPFHPTKEGDPCGRCAKP